ncbi:MAG TPA: EAL domain-containing protein [Acidimicrobiales bacterium]|nr:EAL domain-containing protein [Acidimicrobiales bacterium]
MAEATQAVVDWVTRGRLAWLLALGVLDPAPDPALEAVAGFAARISASDLGIYLTADATDVLVAGSQVDEPSERAEIRVEDLIVGEVRTTGVGRDVLAVAVAATTEALEARLARLRRDSFGGPVAVVVVDGSGDMLWASPEFEELLGWSATERLGRSALELLAPGTADASLNIFASVVASPGRSGNLAHRLLTAAGDAVDFEIQSDNMIASPRVGAITLMLRRAPEHESEATVLSDQIWVLNRLSAGVPLADVLVRVIDMSERRDPDSHACIMRLSEDGMSLKAVLAPHVAAPVEALIHELAVGASSPAGGGTVHFGLPNFASHFPESPPWQEAREVFEASGYETCWSLPVPSMEGSGYLGSLDVYRRVKGVPNSEQTRVLLLAARLTAIAFEHESKTRRLRFNATHDPLTGLANRVLFAESLDAVGGAVGVLFIDLDRFKLVNDTLGHGFGDDLLRAVAGRLADEVPEPGVVARFGGDEFTILLPEVSSLDEVVVTGERLLAQVARSYTVRDQTVTIGASAGATFSTQLPRDADSLVRDADTALYHAKERGRGRVEAFDSRLLSALASRVEVERALRSALDRGELGVVFQPEMDIETGLPTGVEALARCPVEGGDPIPPAVFIPVAEEVGLITRVFEIVLASACRKAKEWNDGRAEPFVVWVNLAPQQLGDPDLVERVSAAIDTAGIAPAMLGFEVTERGILPDPLEAARQLGVLAALGVRIAVDDFGTGHSSLGYLQNLPVDTVKLDRSFVTGAVDDVRSGAIVRAVVDLATAIGLSCVAEGVETAPQLEMVRSLGCRLVQGYVYCHPLPGDELTAWLEGTAAG